MVTVAISEHVGNAGVLGVTGAVGVVGVFGLPAPVSVASPTVANAFLKTISCGSRRSVLITLQPVKIEKRITTNRLFRVVVKIFLVFIVFSFICSRYFEMPDFDLLTNTVISNIAWRLDLRLSKWVEVTVFAGR